MKEQQLWLLIARKLTGEASTHDLHSLNNYLQANPAIAYRVKILEAIWEQPKRLPEKAPVKAFENMMKRIHPGL